MAIKEIKLNAQNFDTLKKFAMVQGDSARVLRCYVDIDLSTVTAARIYIKKADGTEIYNDCTVHDEYIDAPLTTQALAVIGNQIAQLHITDGNGYITTYKFILEVLKSYVSGSAIESSSEFTALENALSTAESLQGQIGDLDDLETTAKDNLVEAINEAKESGGGVEVSATQPTNPMTQVWVDTSETQTIADYVVEQGTSGVWTYRKWNSGKAECWGTITVSNHAMTTPQGNAWYGASTTVSLPTLFNSAPIGNINCRTDSGGYLVHFAIATLSATTLYGYCESINAAITKTVYMYTHLIGTWK